MVCVAGGGCGRMSVYVYGSMLRCTRWMKLLVVVIDYKGSK